MDGEMFFGGIRGLNAFYPDEIKNNPHIPPIVITSFKKLNREVDMRNHIGELEQTILFPRPHHTNNKLSRLLKHMNVVLRIGNVYSGFVES
jgi:hypothetical protein